MTRFDRTRQARWDAGRIHTASTRLTAKQMERFKRQCMLEGQTPYRMVQRLILDWVQQMETGRQRRIEQELQRFQHKQ